MLEKKTLLDQLEIGGDGSVRVRLALVIVEDGIELARSYHRTSFDPAGDTNSVGAQMAAVNSHLVQMSAAVVPVEIIEDIKAHFGLQKTRRAQRRP